MKLNFKKIFAVLVSANCIFLNVGAMHNKNNQKRVENTLRKSKSNKEHYYQVGFFIYFLSKCKGPLILDMSKNRVNSRKGKTHGFGFDKIMSMNNSDDVFVDVESISKKTEKQVLVNNLLIDCLSKCGFVFKIRNGTGPKVKNKFKSVVAASSNTYKIYYDKQQINMIGSCVNEIIFSKLQQSGVINITQDDINHMDSILAENFLSNNANNHDLSKQPVYQPIIGNTYSINFVYIMPNKSNF